MVTIMGIPDAAGPCAAGATALPLEDCARERLHLSNRIQSYGAMVAADFTDHRITYASANTTDVIGATPDQLFDQPVLSLFALDDHERFQSAIEQLYHRPSSHDLFGMRLAGPSDSAVDVILHQGGGHIIVEIQRSHTDDRASLAEVLDASQAMSEAISVPDIEVDVAHIVRALTGFDRAMVYPFHDDGHGEIVAEDCLPHLVRYLGHHFPANDIPSQAREIYLRKASRYIPDANAREAVLIASPRMTGVGLDLSNVSLRSVSPFHLEYMRNMGTAASVSFAMGNAGRLTRLVSCTSENPARLSPATLRSCELVVQQAKLQISAAERISALHEAVEREAIQARLRASMAQAPSVVDGLTANPDDLIGLCDADGVAILIDGQYGSVGVAPTEGAVRQLVDNIRAAESLDKPFATDRLLPSPATSQGAAGCLIVAPGPDDFVAWFRQDLPQQLRWLGNPHAHSAGIINPRTSFDTWLQEISGFSAPWTESNITAAQLIAYEVDSAKLIRAQAELAHQALHDPLTGLPNRRHLTNLLTTMVERATPSVPVAILFIDLNRFKDINDEYGHDVGDFVLCEAARRIADVIRASDVVGRAQSDQLPAGRIGGDEFVVLLAGATADGAARVTERIHQSLCEPMTPRKDLHVTIGAAIGVAVASGPEEPERLLKRADVAMYEHKRQDPRRNR